MRYVQRPPNSEPSYFHSQAVADHRAEIADYLASSVKDERPPRLTTRWDRSVTAALLELFGDKCAYCETAYSIEVDLFRPRAAAENSQGKIDFQYYCWLDTEWQNTYPVCSSCSRSKANSFPVERRGKVGASIADLRANEDYLLLDPCWDFPPEHFSFSPDGYLEGVTQRGEATINILQLNRPDLIKRRYEEFQSFSADLWTLVGGISDFDARWFDNPTARHRGALLIWLFAALPASRVKVLGLDRSSRDTPEVRQAILKSLTSKRKSLARLLFKRPADRSPDLAYEKRHYIRRINIENFRGIDSLALEFPEGQQQIGSIAVLGENASGKSSILQAAALGCLGPDDAILAGFDPDWCLRDGAKSGFVEVEFFDTDRRNFVSFGSGEWVFSGTKQVEVMVLGYGAHRLPARGPVGDPKKGYQYRVHTLLDERALVSGSAGLQTYLRQLDPDSDQAGDIIRSLNELLSRQAKVGISPQHQLTVTDNGREQPLRDLSSGYKSILTLASDILDVIHVVWQGATSGQAFILIDEIDAHLHPAWRLKVVEALRTTFPRSQFLLTTHDPLTLRGMNSDEIRILDKSGSGSDVRTVDDVPLSGLTIDQMLTSELFGMKSTDDPERAAQLDEYYRLLSKGSLDAQDLLMLESLESRLGRPSPIGISRRERLLVAVIEAFLQKTERDAKGDAWTKPVVDGLLAEFEDAMSELGDDL